MASQREKLIIDFKKRSVKMVVDVVDFKDNGHYVVYAPSFKLSAYGESKDEAIKMLFEDVIVDYFSTLLQLKEFEVTSELSKYNWVKGKVLKKVFRNTAYVDKEGILKNFNLPIETPIGQNSISKTSLIAA